MWFNVDKISQIFLRMKKVCSSAQNVSLKRAKPFSKMNYKSRNLFVIALIFSFTLLFYTYYSKNILVGEFLFRSKPFHHLSKSFEKQFYLPPESEVIIELRSRLNLTEPGYMGQPVILPKAVPIDIQTMMNNSFEKYKFNEFVSQLIPLDRELPDFRTDQCKTKQYSENLPKVSVILSFYNEPFSMLMRTVYSILFRSPEELLEEILLVDDCSDDVNLLVQLREVLPHLPIVKIIRSQKRLGLMQARVFGAKNAKGPILIVMDSHMEVTTGWLPPLLDPHVDNHAIVTMPMVEVFDKDTLQYKGVYSGPYNWVGSFTWELMYTWTQIEKLPKRSDVPLRSPTMLGAIFVIRKSYFEYLGYYDEELDLWGGENMELSFKVSLNF